MSKAREYEHKPVQIEGQMRHASLIHCGECGRTDRFVHAGSQKKPPEAIEQYFRNHGWEIGSTARKDRCPDCLKATATKPALRVVEAEPPRQMERDDRRVIFAKIDELYDTNGYVAPWTDRKVAEDLGVPQAWVEQVREEMFGPAGSNPDLDEYLRRVDLVEKDFDAVRQEMADLVAGIGKQLGELQALARKVEKEIGR